MEVSREKLRDEVLSLLNASRELSPSEDHALADTFLTHLEEVPQGRNHRNRRTRPVHAAGATLAVLLAIPVVMVIQAYSSLDGYLPRPDASALPLVYWIALVVAVLVLVATLVSERTGWRLQVTPIRE